MFSIIDFLAPAKNTPDITQQSDETDSTVSEGGAREEKGYFFDLIFANNDAPDEDILAQNDSAALAHIPIINLPEERPLPDAGTITAPAQTTPLDIDVRPTTANDQLIEEATAQNTDIIPGQLVDVDEPVIAPRPEVEAQTPLASQNVQISEQAETQPETGIQTGTQTLVTPPASTIHNDTPASAPSLAEAPPKEIITPQTAPSLPTDNVADDDTPVTPSLSNILTDRNTRLTDQPAPPSRPQQEAALPHEVKEVDTPNLFKNEDTEPLIKLTTTPSVSSIEVAGLQQSSPPHFEHAHTTDRGATSAHGQRGYEPCCSANR